MRRSTVIRISAAAVSLAAWISIEFSLHGGFGPSMDTAAYQASGKLMAQQALAHLKSGGEITVFYRDTADFKNPATDLQLASFRKALAQAHATIHALHALKVDPLRPTEVPASDFYDAMKAVGKGGVIVSFMGPPPLLTPAQRNRLGDTIPAVVAFCPGNIPVAADLPGLFQQGALAAAVVEQQTTSRGATPGPAYTVVTSGNLTDPAPTRPL